MTLRFFGIKTFLIIRKISLFKIAHIKNKLNKIAHTKDLSKGNSCYRIQGKADQGFRKGWH